MIPRRNRLDLNTPAELAIYNAMQEVEKVGADVRLTEITNMLVKAKELLSNYIDIKWQQEQENTANDILNYILTNDDGVGITLGYNSREMIEQHFKNIGYEKHTRITNR